MGCIEARNTASLPPPWKSLLKLPGVIFSLQLCTSQYQEAGENDSWNYTRNGRVRLDAVPEPLWRRRSAELLWTICVAASGCASLTNPCVRLQDLAGSSLPLLATLTFPNPKRRAGLHPDKELLPGQRERQEQEGRSGVRAVAGGAGAVSGGAASPEHPLAPAAAGTLPPGLWHRAWDHCSCAKTCHRGSALSPEIMRYMVCVS